MSNPQSGPPTDPQFGSPMDPQSGPPMGQQSSPPYPVPPYPAPRPPKRLVRSRNDKWLSGVCGGVAEYLGVDANLVRLVVVLGTILGFGSLLIAYIVAWILMPEE